jgi:hypothetical protein
VAASSSLLLPRCPCWRAAHSTSRGGFVAAQQLGVTQVPLLASAWRHLAVTRSRRKAGLPACLLPAYGAAFCCPDCCAFCCIAFIARRRFLYSSNEPWKGVTVPSSTIHSSSTVLSIRCWSWLTISTPPCDQMQQRQQPSQLAHHSQVAWRCAPRSKRAHAAAACCTTLWPHLEHGQALDQRVHARNVQVVAGPARGVHDKHAGGPAAVQGSGLWAVGSGLWQPRTASSPLPMASGTPPRHHGTHSSRSSMCGLSKVSLANATRDFWPPDSCHMGCRARGPARREGCSSGHDAHARLRVQQPSTSGPAAAAERRRLQPLLSWLLLEQAKAHPSRQSCPGEPWPAHP